MTTIQEGHNKKGGLGEQPSAQKPDIYPTCRYTTDTEEDKVHQKISQEIEKRSDMVYYRDEFIRSGSGIMQYLTKKGFTSNQVYQYLYNTMLNDV